MDLEQTVHSVGGERLQNVERADRLTSMFHRGRESGDIWTRAV